MGFHAFVICTHCLHTIFMSILHYILYNTRRRFSLQVAQTEERLGDIFVKAHYANEAFRAYRSAKYVHSMLGKGKIREVRVISRKEAKLKELLLSGAMDTAPEQKKKKKPQSAVQSGRSEDVFVSLPSTTRNQEEDKSQISSEDEEEGYSDDQGHENENKSFIVSPMSASLAGEHNEMAAESEEAEGDDEEVEGDDEEGGNVLSALESEGAQSKEKETGEEDPRRDNWLSPIKQAPTPQKQTATPKQSPRPHAKSPQRSRSPEKRESDDEFNF